MAASEAGTNWQAAYRDRIERTWTPTRRAELTRGKQMLVTPWEAPFLLRSLGILDADGDLQPSRTRKLRQVSHLLGFLRPALEDLPAGTVRIVDAGCGRSTLGALVCWWLERQGRPARLLGLDRNRKVLEGCRERARDSASEQVFLEADLASADLGQLWATAFEESATIDVLLALHACDTATDDALAMVVREDVGFFAVAPCCQAELARAWAALPPGPLAPLHGVPHYRRTMAATVTDAMRAELMRSRGYDVRSVELVEAHHTPKNTLLYGHRRGPPTDDRAYRELARATGGAGIGLADRLDAADRCESDCR